MNAGIEGAEAATPKGTATSKVKKSAPGSLSRLARVRRFFASVVSELLRVVWPTRSELIRSTTIVLVFTVAATVAVAVADVGAAKLASLLFGS